MEATGRAGASQGPHDPTEKHAKKKKKNRLQIRLGQAEEWGGGVGVNRVKCFLMVGNGIFQQDGEGAKQNKDEGRRRENRIVAGVEKGM